MTSRHGRGFGRLSTWRFAAWFMLASTPATAQEHQDLAQQAVDPTASLMSFQIVDNYSAELWGEDGTSNEVLFRAAIPFRAWGASNILRFTAPYTTGGVRGSGSEATQLFDLIVMQESWGRWGFGPLVSLGNGTGPNGPGPFAAGPAFGVVVQRGKWTFGLLSQNLFGRDIAVFQLQPIIAYQLGGGWTLSAGDVQFPYDSRAGSFLGVPLSAQLGRVTKVGGQPVRLFVNPQYNTLNTTGADRWKFGFGFALLVPTASASSAP